MNDNTNNELYTINYISKIDLSTVKLHGFTHLKDHLYLHVFPSGKFFISLHGRSEITTVNYFEILPDRTVRNPLFEAYLENRDAFDKMVIWDETGETYFFTDTVV